MEKACRGVPPGLWSASSRGGALVRNRGIGGSLAHAAEEIVGRDELLVLGGIRRNVSRGSAALFLVAAVLQVTAQAGFALGLVLALQLLGNVLQHLHVRIDALGLDGAARRGVVARRGQAHGSVTAERDDGLHGAL